MANDARLAFVLRLADDHLILGHRLSEWCGHAPMLEEDLAMPNMALDLIGQARALYQYAAEIEGKGRTEDDLAYLRREREYTNCLMVERPNGDFAHTMLRQLYFAAFMEPMWRAMAASKDETLGGIAAKAVKEIEHKGFTVRAAPFQEGGQYQTAGSVVKVIDGVEKEHRFIRADRFASIDAAADVALAKGRQIIDEQGEHIFR